MTGPAAVEAVDAVELVRARLPLRRPFRTSFGVQHERDALLVRVATADGAEGWGECVTTAAPVYSSEYTDGAAAVLADHLVPRLLAAPETRWHEIGRLLAPVRGHRMAKAALEVAVADAQLRREDTRLADALGGVRDLVPAGVSVGIPAGGAPALAETVARHLDEGYLRIKVKIEPGFDVAPLQALRTRFGDGLALQVDANAAYEPDEAEHLRALDALDELGLELIEQPFAPNRLLAHAQQARRWATPICLDESIEDAHDAGEAIALGAAAIVNIKLGRVGGLRESQRVHDACRQAGVPVWCGGMLETGVGRAANVALASLPGFTMPGDCSASDRYFDQDLTEPFVLEAGHLRVPRGPGLGVSPRPEMLRGATRRRLAPR